MRNAMFRLQHVPSMAPIRGTTFGAYSGEWCCPEFDRESVQELMDWDNTTSQAACVSWWEGDVAVFGNLDGPKRYERNVGTGLWSIGAGEWPWIEVELIDGKYEEVPVDHSACRRK